MPPPVPPAAAAPPPGDAVAALCAEHAYPPEVEAVLREVVARLATLAPRSVLLHGSAARGELTWWRDGAGRVRLASDVEMYVVGHAFPPAEERARVDAELAALAERVNGAGPALFHADAGYTTLPRLLDHPRTFRLWDTRETGRTLLGEDLRGRLAALEPGDIDLRQLNEVPVHRLWEMALRAPRALVEGGGAAPEAERLWGYVCARQALDLTTWLLPRFGVLVPTFRRRVDFWEEHVSALPLARYFPPDSGAFLRECLDAKLRFRLARPPAAMHAAVLDHFRAGLRLLLALPPGADDAAVAAAAVRQGGAHWNRLPPRSRAWQAYTAARAGAPAAALRLLWERRRPREVAALLHLNAALAALLAGRDAGAPLAAAEAALGRLWHGFRPRAGAPPARWLAARHGYVDYLTRSGRWFGARRGYLLSVIED